MSHLKANIRKVPVDDPEKELLEPRDCTKKSSERVEKIVDKSVEHNEYRPRVFAEWQRPLCEWMEPLSEWQRPLNEWQAPLSEWYLPSGSRLGRLRKEQTSSIFQP